MAWLAGVETWNSRKEWNLEFACGFSTHIILLY